MEWTSPLIIRSLRRKISSIPFSATKISSATAAVNWLNQENLDSSASFAREIIMTLAQKQYANAFFLLKIYCNLWFLYSTALSFNKIQNNWCLCQHSTCEDPLRKKNKWKYCWPFGDFAILEYQWLLQAAQWASLQIIGSEQNILHFLNTINTFQVTTCHLSRCYQPKHTSHIRYLDHSGEYLQRITSLKMFWLESTPVICWKAEIWFFAKRVTQSWDILEGDHLKMCFSLPKTLLVTCCWWTLVQRKSVIALVWDWSLMALWGYSCWQAKKSRRARNCSTATENTTSLRWRTKSCKRRRRRRRMSQRITWRQKKGEEKEDEI